MPLTGKFSPVAGKFDRIYYAWRDLINQRGGLWVEELGTRVPVETIIYDDKSDPATSARLYERLITQDKCDLLLGPYVSPITIAAAPVATKYGVPFITTQAGAPPIYNTGSDWIVTPIDLVTNWAGMYFEFIKSEGKARSISFVIEDNAYAQGLGQGAINIAKSNGLEVKAVEVVSPGTTDFSSTILKLKSASADIIFVASLAPFATTFVKQAHEQGLKPNEFHVPQLIKSFIEGVGKDVANYITGEWYWTENLPYDDEWGKEFWIKVLEKAGLKNEDHPWAVVTYYGLEVAGAAVEQSPTLNKKDLMDTIRSMYIMTVSGPLYFRDYDSFKGIGTLRPFPVQYQNGEFVILYPEDVKTGEHVYPAP